MEKPDEVYIFSFNWMNILMDKINYYLNCHSKNGNIFFKNICCPSLNMIRWDIKCHKVTFLNAFQSRWNHTWILLIIISYILQITRLFMNNLNVQPLDKWVGWDWQSSEDKTQKPHRDEDPLLPPCWWLKQGSCSLNLSHVVSHCLHWSSLLYHIFQRCRGCEFSNKCEEDYLIIDAWSCTFH